MKHSETERWGKRGSEEQWRWPWLRGGRWRKGEARRGGRKWGKKLDLTVEEEQKKINSSQATINALKLDMSLKNENGEIAVRIQIFFPRQRF
jgi:hypothetical protein